MTTRLGARGFSVVRMSLTCLCCLGAAACISSCGLDPIAEMDEVYFGWDEQRVVCGVGIDEHLGNTLESFAGGVERARDRDEVLIVYGHKPGRDFSLSRLESLLEIASTANVPFLGFDELGPRDGAARPGIALSFDDWWVDAWHDMAPLLQRYGARVTFFVARLHTLSSGAVDKLHALARAGHTIGVHGRAHLHGPDYVAEYGLQAYVHDEIVDALDEMTRAGFTARSMAYPFGATTSEIDQVALEQLQFVRSIAWSHRFPLVTDPCPL